MNNKTLIELNIDDKLVKIEKGKTILDAAKSIEIEIPTLCYNPELKPYGACRLCLVEITKNGKQSLVASCVYPAEEGVVVKTDTEHVVKARKFILELMLAEAPDSPELKQLAEQYNIEKSRFKELEDKPRECILCGLCVRVCNEIVKKDILTFGYRGSKCKVTTAFSRLFDDEVCTNCGKCVYICPVEQG